jgi:prephenate dehydratase
MPTKIEGRGRTVPIAQIPPKQKPVAAFQGELGAFSHAAARKLLGENTAVLPCPSFDEVFQALKSGKSTHAVLPIENTLHGSIHENYDHLLEYELPIIGETSIRISHQLIAMPGTRFRNVRRVYSHPVALNQCLSFFERHTNIEKTPYYDTAGSVKMLLAEHPPGSAAIASEAAAAIYDGVILKRNIEDDRKNFTRFFLLGRKQEAAKRAARRWKTSLAFSTPNVPGSLFKAMACFALRDVNLTKLESRPLRGRPWEYLFYLDLTGHAQEPQVLKAIANLGEITSFLRVLGSYEPTD